MNYWINIVAYFDGVSSTLRPLSGAALFSSYTHVLRTGHFTTIDFDSDFIEERGLYRMKLNATFSDDDSVAMENFYILLTAATKLETPYLSIKSGKNLAKP